MGFFSFFSRKNRNRNKGDNAQGPESANGLSAREIARRTAEKIDEIESQMVQEDSPLAAAAPAGSGNAQAAPAAEQTPSSADAPRTMTDIV